MSLNLASQPFVNSRPVRRLVLVLWCLSVLLIGANVFFYARHFTGQQARRDRLAALAEQEARESERLAELERELAGFDVDWQNRQIEFLNLRIAERVFPWSGLFDRLTQALPPNVRLVRLRPLIESRADADSPGEVVRLEIRGEARLEQAVLNFVDRLFKHRAFRNPNLASESRRPRSETIEFSLSVDYLPARAAAVPARAKPGPAGGGGQTATAGEAEGGR